MNLTLWIVAGLLAGAAVVHVRRNETRTNPS
jgi:hypothetical protein